MATPVRIELPTFQPDNEKLTMNNFRRMHTKKWRERHLKQIASLLVDENPDSNDTSYEVCS